MKLDGFGIMVDDMAVMVRFYRDVLGFEIKRKKTRQMFFLRKTGPCSCSIGKRIVKR